MMRMFDVLRYEVLHEFKARWGRIFRRLTKWERCFICRERWGSRYLFIIGLETTTHVWMCNPCLRETVSTLVPLEHREP